MGERMNVQAGFERMLDSARAPAGQACIAILLLCIALFAAASKSAAKDRTFVIETEVVSLHEHEHSAGLGASSHDPLVRSPAISIPEDMAVTSIQVRVINAPQTVIHHLRLVAPEIPDPICPTLPRTFFVISPTSSFIDIPMQIPPPYAMQFAQGTKLMIDAMLHDPPPPQGPGGTYEDVSVQVTLTYTRTSSLRPVGDILLALGNRYCATESKELAGTFDVPPHSRSFVMKEDPARPGTGQYEFPTSGTIVYARGHIHPFDGGKKLTLYLNGRDIAEFTAHRVGEDPWSFMIPTQILNLRVQKGDVVSISAEYENLTKKSNRGAMGMAAIFFSPDLQ